MPITENYHPALDLKTLKSAIDTIFPGAVQAKAQNYILNTIIMTGELNTYREGLRELNRLTWEIYQLLFAELALDQRVIVLHRMQDTDFFDILRQHTMEGVFADPIYGGNDNKIGWKIIGFPGSRFHPVTHLSRGWKAREFVSLADEGRLREDER